MSVKCKALKLLGFIKQNTTNFSPVCCLRAHYFSLVQQCDQSQNMVSQYDTLTQRKTIQLKKGLKRSITGFSHAAFLLKIDHPLYDYSTLLSSLNILTLSYYRNDAELHFIQGMLKESTDAGDAPDLLSSINFHAPTYPSKYHVPLHIPTHTTSYSHNHSLHRMLRSTSNATNVF